MERRAEVQRDDQVPFGNREVFQRRNMLYAGIVDQNVRSAEIAHDIAHHAFNRVRVGQVCIRIADLHAVLFFHAGALGLDGVLVAEAVQNDITSLSRETLGDRFSDPAC